MTAHGTTHTKEEATVDVCNLNMFVQVPSLRESPAVLSLGNGARKTVIRMNGIHVSHHISSRLGETSNMSETHNRIPLVVPRRACNRSPDPSSG